MNDESFGPFRRDGRMRFVTESRDDEAALRALRVPASMEFPTYVFVLALGPIAFAVAGSAPWLLVVSALLILFAFKAHQSFAAARKNAPEPVPRRTFIAEDGLFLDGRLGPTKWEWDAVDDVRIVGDHVVIQLNSRQAMVLPVRGKEAERLVAFVQERAELKLTSHPGRLVFLLGVLYAVCVATSLVVLH